MTDDNQSFGQITQVGQQTHGFSPGIYCFFFGMHLNLWTLPKVYRISSLLHARRSQNSGHRPILQLRHPDSLYVIVISSGKPAQGWELTRMVPKMSLIWALSKRKSCWRRRQEACDQYYSFLKSCKLPLSKDLLLIYLLKKKWKRKFFFEATFFLSKKLKIVFKLSI